MVDMPSKLNRAARWKRVITAICVWQLLDPTLSFSPPSQPISPLSGKSSDSLSSPTTTAIMEFYTTLDVLYDQSSSIKCPFFRRRVADTIDGVAMLFQFLLIRHKSLIGSDQFIPDAKYGEIIAPGCKPLGRHIAAVDKSKHLDLSIIASQIHQDWIGGSLGCNKGYYITGKLNSTIYRDDCLFTGPDPDMPVKGLRKYLSAAAQLFDKKHSYAIAHEIHYEEGGGGKNSGVVEVRWKLGGVIMLPWHPTLEPWTGWTRYHLDEESLIYWHEEGWDISIWRAFLCTLFPGVRSWSGWKKEQNDNMI